MGTEVRCVGHVCRGAASIDAQEAHSHEHYHSERHTGHQLPDIHPGRSPE